jgi:LysR family hydrogen peroxide-inducible transcriptional activator
MNIRDFKYIIAVADYKSFYKAAMHCNVSQPTLSGQIKKLEDYLGNKIFERTTKSLSITPFGEEIISKARVIIQDVDALTEFSFKSKNPWSLPLKVGIIPTLGPYLIPKFYLYLKKTIPEAKVIFDENITSILLDKLSSGELDVLLISDMEKNSAFTSIDLFEEPFWVAFKRGNQLEHLNSVQPKDLASQNVLLLNKTHCLRSQISNLISQQDESDLNTIASSLETLINLVAAGEGCTLVPALALQSAWTTDMGILVRKLDDQSANRKIRLVYRKNFTRTKQVHELAKMIGYQSPNTVKILMKN